jgi:hypothetical protein
MQVWGADMNSLSSPSKPRLYSGLLMGALIVFVAVLALTWGYFKYLPGCAVDDLVVVITNPKDETYDLPTSQHVPVEGTYAGNLARCEIWVLVHSGSDGKYYPQAINNPQLPGNCKKVPVLRSKGRWNTFFYDTNVERLDLIVMVTDTDSPADRLFKDWAYRAGCPNPLGTPQPFPGGIRDLPSPLTEIDRISIGTR